MQSALRSAARRAACAATRRGVAATTTKAAAAAAAAYDNTVAAGEREWVTALVQREVRAEMRAAKEEEALEALRATAKAVEACHVGDDEWWRGFRMGYTSAFLSWGWGYLYLIFRS